MGWSQGGYILRSSPRRATASRRYRWAQDFRLADYYVNTDITPFTQQFCTARVGDPEITGRLRR